MRSSEATLLSELRELSETNSATLIRPIVPIDEWLESPYYIGDLCYELYPKYKQHLRSIFDPERDESDYIDEVIMRCSIGTGKEMPMDTIIPTPSGDKRFGDLKVGDYVFGSDGKPTRVLGVYPQGLKDVYRVHFKDGSYLDVGLEHLWTLSVRSDKIDNSSRTFTTKELMNYIETKEPIQSYMNYTFYWLPIISQPLQYTDVHEPLCDPYVLGALIADGSLTCCSSTEVSWTKYEQSVIDEMRSRCNLITYTEGRHYIDDKNIIDALRYYGLLGCQSRQKHLHPDLFRMSPENRLLLLQGMMDGDGTPARYDRVNKQYTPFAYGTMSDQLSKDVIRLVTGLGGYATEGKAKGNTYKGVYKDCNYIWIESSFNPFLACRWKKSWEFSKSVQKMHKHNRRLERIEKLSNPVEQQCIKVDDPNELYVADTQFHILTHNTSVSNVILLRKLYELSCYSDIRPLYNLMSSKTILMVYFSITREVAETTGYSQLRQMLLDIPYFKEHFSPNTKRSYDIDFPQYNMSITSGSRPANALGGDVIASVIDEGDFYGVAGTQDSSGSKSLSKAQSLYSSITKRARSRFMVGGRNYALNMIISSPTYESSFISKLIESSRGNPHTYIIEETLWTVKPKGTYSEERFVVFKGSTTLDPVIVTETNFLNQFLATMYKPPIKFTTDDPVKAISELPLDLQNYFIKIPVDFRKDFEIDLLGSLQDIASVPTAPLGRLFTSTRHYTYAIQNMQSPFIQDSIIISTNKMDETTIQKYFKPDYKPEHPELPRFLHFDQSITGDEAGVACAYPEILGRDKDGNIIKRITVEWMMLIKPPNKPEQIDLRKMRSILYYLRDTLHLRIGLVTFDSFASEEAIQVLRNDGFNAELLSVDRTDKPYTELVQLYYQQLIRHPDHQRYREELFALIHYRDKGKVDHTENLDKGITDAVAGSVYNALLRTDIYSELAKEDVNVILNLL